ncbi:13918_t:CDS:1, partial [Gigaspora rosea]
MSKKDKEINLQALELDRNYTIEEFETINKQLKSKPIEINKQPVDLFEYKNKKLAPMPQRTIMIEAVVAHIVSQLDRWNIATHRNGVITSSQGGFNFNVGGKRTIVAPDVAFTPRRKYDSLTQEQRQTFKGEPFTPTFVVEVGNVAKPSDFRRLDFKFKNDYFTEGSAVQLGWLIDPINKKIYVYRKGTEGEEHGWNDVSGDEVLPDFTLKVWRLS